MDKAYFVDLYRYNFWANRQVWKCAMALTDGQFDQPQDYSVGSVHDQLVHVLSVEYWWFFFLKERRLQFLEQVDDLRDRDAIRARWDAVEQYNLAYLETLTPAELERDVRPPFWENRKPVKVWNALIQVANHSTDHRAQTLAHLHTLGVETVGQDYLDYILDVRG